jgi:hypothetical protein
VYLKLVVLHGTSYFMAITKTDVCLVSFDRVGDGSAQQGRLLVELMSGNEKKLI